MLQFCLIDGSVFFDFVGFLLNIWKNICLLDSTFIWFNAINLYFK